MHQGRRGLINESLKSKKRGGNYDENTAESTKIHFHYKLCLGFGMTHTQTMTRVVLPQAAVAAIPPIVNSAIDIIKMSSLGMTIGIQDVMGEAQLSAAVSYKTFETYIIAAAFYWILALILGKIQRIVERKIGVAYQK